MAKTTQQLQESERELSGLKLSKLQEDRYSAEIDLVIIRIGEDLFKIWVKFEIINTSDQALTVDYTVTELFLAEPETRLNRVTRVVGIPAPPSLADRIYNPQKLSSEFWRKIHGEAFVFQESPRTDEFLVTGGGYTNPTQGGGGTGTLRTGERASQSPAYLLRAPKNGWIAAVVNIGLNGERYQFFHRTEPLRPGIGENEIERWNRK